MEEIKRIFSLAMFLIICYRTHSQGPQNDVVVAKDGSGKFTRISDAIWAAPNFSLKRYCIKIKEGFYEENIIVEQKKTNLMLLGDGMDKTIISGKRSTGGGFGTNDTATVAVYGRWFTAQGITFENVAGPHMQQAVALEANVTHCAFYQCRFKGYQDTLYTNSGFQFFRECEIIGTVDFIFGDASAVFQNSFIYVREPLLGQQNIITAQGREFRIENTGIVLHNCTIAAYPGSRPRPRTFQTFLGRPWKTFSRTVIIQSYIDDLIDPKGWIGWPGQVFRKPMYLEFNNRGPGANTNNRVPWATITSNRWEAGLYTVRNFIKGTFWLPRTGFPYILDLLW